MKLSRGEKGEMSYIFSDMAYLFLTACNIYPETQSVFSRIQVDEMINVWEIKKGVSVDTPFSLNPKNYLIQFHPSDQFDRTEQPHT